MFDDRFILITSIVIGLLSVARTARLIGFDEYPPMEYLREKWNRKFGTEGWGKLIHCPFCSAPYLTAGMTLWWSITFTSESDLAQLLWWLINGVWGLSYLASILVAYDQPED